MRFSCNLFVLSILALLSLVACSSKPADTASNPAEFQFLFLQPEHGGAVERFRWKCDEFSGHPGAGNGNTAPAAAADASCPRVQP